MVTLTQETFIELAAGECCGLADLRDHLLTCSSGELRIAPNSAGTARQLAGGEQMRIADNGRLTLEALAPTKLHLTHGQALGPYAAVQGCAWRQWLAASPLLALPATLLR